MTKLKRSLSSLREKMMKKKRKRRKLPLKRRSKLIIRCKRRNLETW